ncbi:MAG: antibiotic biosynthesis monooxygenase family protein [Pseudomonadota bacterium]
MAVTLINVFIVPKEKEDEFLENWKKTTTVFVKDPGFIEAHLHRNQGTGNGTFSFINIARWESAEAWRVAHDAYSPSEYRIPGVKGHPAIFEPIVDAVREGTKPAAPNFLHASSRTA